MHAIFYSVTVVFALSQYAHCHNMHYWRTWKITDGLAESYSRTVSVSSDGIVWVNHGDIPQMSWLDGYFVHNIVSPKPMAPVYENQSHDIWASYDGGLQQYINGKWIQYPINDFEASTPFLPASSDEIFILFSNSIIVFDAKTHRTKLIKHVQETNLGQFKSFSITKNDSFWISGEYGLAKMQASILSSRPTEWKEYNAKDIGIHNFREPLEGENGEVFISASCVDKPLYALMRMHDSEWRMLYSSEEEIIRGWRGSDGNIWVQSKDSFARITKNGVEIKETEEEFLGQIFSIALDRNEAFWLATSHGLLRYTPPLWRTPNAFSNIDTNVYAIAEDKNGAIWSASKNALIYYKDDDEWKIYPYPNGVEGHGNETDALCFLPDGRLLMNCTVSRHLLTFNPANEKYEFIQHPQKRHVRLIASRSDGSVWIRTYEDGENYCLEIFDGAEFRLFLDFKDENRPIHIRHVCEMETGDIWIGDLYGLVHYKDGTYRIIGEKEGYQGMGGLYIRDLKNGKIWVGDRNRVFEYDGKDWNVVLSDFDIVYSITPSKIGGMWVASSVGLNRYLHGSWIRIETEEGLPSSIVNKVFEDSQNRIWVGTNKGLRLYYPLADQDPPETILSLQENLQETPPDGKARIVFSGIDKWKATPDNRLLYAWRLDASEWSKFSAENFVSFVNLPPGKHHFEVSAMDRNFNVDPTPASMEFTVLLPWHRTSDFLLLTLLSGSAIAALLLFAISHHRRVEKLVGLRTAELTIANLSLQREIVEKNNAEEALAASERLYRKAIEAAEAVPYYRNYITDAYDFVGDRIESLIGYPTSEFTPELWKSIVRKIIPSGKCREIFDFEYVDKFRQRDEIYWNADFLIKTRQNVEKWISNAAVDIRNEKGELVGSLGLLQDITDRKNTENALRENEARISALVQAIPDLIMRINKEGLCLDYKLPKEFHASPLFMENMIGQNIFDVWPSEASHSLFFYVQRSLETGKAELFEFQVRLNGEIYKYDAKIVASGENEGLAIIRDITQKKQLEKEILMIREMERKRIGDELHDDLCQSLTGAAIKSKILEDRLAKQSLKEAEESADITKIINQAITKTRMIAKGLHPIDLEIYGLKKSLASLVENMKTLFNISCSFKSNLASSVDFDESIHIYRIAQEAIINAIKHGQAKRVWVELMDMEDHIVLRVEDDGVGIPSDYEKNRGMGIRIMNYRARTIGAYLDIQRLISGGTLITCSYRRIPN